MNSQKFFHSHLDHKKIQHYLYLVSFDEIQGVSKKAHYQRKIKVLFLMLYL